MSDNIDQYFKADGEPEKDVMNNVLGIFGVPEEDKVPEGEENGS